MKINVLVFYRMVGDIVEVDIVYRLICLLNESERKLVFKEAMNQGFNVDGFKDITKAPLSKVKGVLRNKNRKKRKYTDILLDAISQIKVADDEMSQCEIYLQVIEIAKLFMENGINQVEQINEKLLKLELKREELLSKDKNTYITSKEDTSKVTTTSEMNNITTNKNEIEILRKKNSNLQEKIMDYKIQIDNIQKDKKLLQHEKEFIQKELVEVEKLNKDYENVICKLKSEILTKDQYIDSIVVELNLQLNTIKELNNTINNYEENINRLKILSMNRNRVLCFSKKIPEDNKFIGLDIVVESEWDEAILKQIEWNKYDQIWVITQDVPFGSIRKIQTISGVEIKKYYSFNSISV